MVVRCSHRYRYVSSKGAILTLIWNALVCSFFVASTFDLLLSRVPYSQYVNAAIHAVNTIFFYPLAGWLADVYFGRYRVIRVSIWIMWVGMLLVAVCLGVEYLISNTSKVGEDVIRFGIFPLVYLLENIGLAGFQPNIVPFGIDQFQGLPSAEITAYVHWFVLTMYASKFVFLNPLNCINSDLFYTLMALICVACLSIAISSDFLFRNHFIIEPESRNPLKIIFQVLKYALENKHPKKRSALSFCDDEKPSRIDFGKSKYGGPFSTEQVEDVKTCLRILAFLVVMNFFFIAAYGPQNAKPYLIRHLFSSGSCYERGFLTNLRIYCNVAFIVVHELFVYPILCNRMPSILKRFGFAIVLFLLSNFFQFGIDIVGHLQVHTANVTLPCMFASHKSVQTLPIDYRWIVGSEVLSGIANVYVNISVFELVCAQAPYSMKGLLIGLIYSLNGLCSAINGVFPLVFAQIKPTKGRQFLTCGFAFYLTNTVILLVGIAIFSALAKWYKLRKRDERPYDHRYAEEYYNKYRATS